MKFIHTSDLHLGKVLNDISFLDDQIHILNQIIAIAQSEKADALIIAGDVYQKSSPPAEAMAAFDNFITKIIALGVKVFIISGNHDSSQRISYFSSLVRTSGVYITEAFEGALQTISLSDEHGPVAIHLLPFIKPFMAKRAYPDAQINSYQDAVKTVLDSSPVDTSVRNILVCHQFITGAETSDSEEVMVGGLDQISADIFDSFDYVALGHIHKPQRVRRETLRYAGSPLKYSFSEANHKKSVAVVEMGKKGDISINLIPLTPIRDLRLVEGMLSDIMSMPPSPDYVWVTVNDELVHPDARLDVTSVFPNMMKFSVNNSRTREDVEITSAENVENKDISQLFADFYRMQNNDADPTPEHMEVLEKVLKKLEDARHEAN